MRIFISHSWKADATYGRIVRLLNDTGVSWENVSIPAEHPEDIVRRAREEATYAAAALRARATASLQEIARLQDQQALLVERQSAASAAVRECHNARSMAMDQLAAFRAANQREIGILRADKKLAELIATNAGERVIAAERRWLESLVASPPSGPGTAADVEEQLAASVAVLENAKRELELNDRIYSEISFSLGAIVDRIAALRRSHDEDQCRASTVDQATQEVNWKDIVRRDPKLNLPRFHFDNAVTKAIGLAIYERIRDCTLVIAACTADYEYQPWLDFEFQAAASFGRPVVAVLDSPTDTLPINYRYWVSATLRLPLLPDEVLATLSHAAPRTDYSHRADFERVVRELHAETDKPSVE